MLVVCYVLVALSCILSVVPFPVYDIRYDREGTGSEEWTWGFSRSRPRTYCQDRQATSTPYWTPTICTSMSCFQNKIMHVLSFMWHFATQKIFYKILFGQRYLLVYKRFYKNRSSLEKPSTEGAIKKIIFSSSISLYPYLKTIGWEPGFWWNVFGRKPESLGAIGEKVFYKTHVAGSKWRCL